MAFELTGTIRANPERVFAVLSDLGQARQWMPAIQQIDDVTPGPFQLGTKWRETRLAGKRTMESTVRVAALERPSRLGLEVDGKAMMGRMTFTLTPKQGTTEVHYEAQMKGKGLFRLVSGTMNRMMAQADADLLDRLKNQVEGKP